MKEKGNKKMPTQRKNAIQPIRTSLFLFLSSCLMMDHNIYIIQYRFLKETKYVGMGLNDFLSLYRHLLVPLFFHKVTSLHLPSFQRNDFPIILLICMLFG